MEFLVPLLSIGVTQLLAVMSPGQSFVVVSRTALANGRGAALAVTLGMGVGTVFWASAAMGGLAVLLGQAAWLYIALKLGAGIYLLFLAVAIWRGASRPADVEDTATRPMGFATALRLGFLTQIANPKVIVFFGSIFVALLPAQPPFWVSAAVLLIVFANETGWLAVVSCLFSSAGPRRAYLRLKRWIDRIMAVLLAAIGGRLVVDAAEGL